MKLYYQRFFLWAILLLLTTSVGAKPITREEARQRAEKYLQTCPGSRMLSPVVSRNKLAPRRAKALSADKELYYVFNRGEQQGYVIVSGNDQTLPILGYTEDGEFDYTQIPDNMRSWLDRRERQLAALNEASATTEQPRYARVHDRIEPMITTRWNQGSPYNDECPMYFTLGRSVTGCVATAMAQVLYYQRAKSVTETQADIPAYDTWTSHETYGKLHVEGIPAGSPIDWDNMLDTYNGSTTAVQRKAVAQLMHYCGVSVHMDYTNRSSGAQSSEVANAMVNYFGYGSSVKYVGQWSYSEEAWDEMLYNELLQGRPFYLSGANSEAGHAFVCDGYDGNHCFHINWGWGGQSDGFFLLTSLNPSSQGIGGSGDGYSQYEEAIIGCEPENYGNKEMPIENLAVKTACIKNFDTDGDGKFSFGEAASVTSLGSAFRGTRIVTFPELYYFTSLTEIEDSAFAACTSLTNIRLPKGITRIGNHAFEKCTKLKNINIPDGVASIGEAAFAGCKVLVNPIIPTGLIQIGNRAFENCVAISEVSFTSSVVKIGDEAYSGCTKLQTVSVQTMRPQDIRLGESVFNGIDLTEAELNIVQGTHEYFANDPQWSAFGNIIQLRNLAQGEFMELTTNKYFYLYNLGTGRYMTKGEAWGTQAVVADTDNPMRFQLRHTASMPDGVYALYSPDTDKDGHFLFRTKNDPYVGIGVNACFVDNAAVDTTAYWQVKEQGDYIYTFQVPSTLADYDETKFLGIMPNHASNYASPTYGAYSDVSYYEFAKNCQWMFVEYDANRTATYQAARVLGNLLTQANKKRLDTVQEQAVYDSFDSDIAAIKHAQSRLRKKLNFIDFKDEKVYALAVATWDVDGNGEISMAEATASEGLGSNFYGNANIVTFDEFQYFTNVGELSGNSFLNCSALTSITLPKSLSTIYYRAFMGCKKLAAITLPEHISYLGDDVFNGCKGLKAVTVYNPDPSTIEISYSTFSSLTLGNLTLRVPYGTKELYAAAPIWKNFGNIVEIRPTTSEPAYSALETGSKFYVMNVGLRRFLNKGEAYGTQSVVALEGVPYVLRRSNNMPDSVYYLSSEAIGSSKNVLFRTHTDSKVGTGVKCCFADGQLSAKAYWRIHEVEPNVYTIQIPENDEEYVEGEFLGVMTDHESNNYPTYGNYYDIPYDGNEKNCQWVLISEEEIDKAAIFDEKVANLAQLLERAADQDIEAVAEQAVYDNFQSTDVQLDSAILSLREKLHYIDFYETRMRTICLNAWDDNNDDELTREEAATVTNLGTRFALLNSIHGVDELKYFTGLTQIPDGAFRKNIGIVSAYIPENVTTIGTDAYSGCTALKYIAVLNPTKVVDATLASLPKDLVVFVPEAMIDAYKTDSIWGQYDILKFDGIAVIQPDSASRQYGRVNPSKYTYVVTGAPINGEPAFESVADLTSPVGEYPVIVDNGTITSPFTFLPGVLTVTKAPLTISVKSYTRNRGEENPEFALTYRTFRNKEKNDVLLRQPTVECDATIDSPAGEYEIRVFGAEAENYEITYVNGILTVIDPNAIVEVADTEGIQPVFDLQGRCVGDTRSLRTLPRGIYTIAGRKVAIK